MILLTGAACASAALHKKRIARAGRERVLAAHTADRRALDLENILEAAVSLPVEEARAAE